MTNDSRDLYTIAEAAAAWGISRQAVYKRLSTIDNQVDNQPCIVVKGKQRYITRDCIEAYRGEVNQVDNQPTTKRQPTDNQLTTEVDRLTTEVDRLKAALLEEQGRTSTLQAEIDAQRAALLEAQGRASSLQAALEQAQATIEGYKAAKDAQQAHIDSLQAALDKTQTALNQEQTLHLATMQQRLPAGRGSSFMDWITGRGKKTRGTE